MQKIVIFGCHNFSRMLRKYIDNDKRYKVIAYTVNKEYNCQKTFDGLPVVDFERIEEIYNINDILMQIALGYSRMNDVRKEIFEQVKMKGYHILTYIHPSTNVMTEQVGEGCIILEGANIGCDCVLGKGNIVNTAAMVGHNTEVGDFNFFAGNSTIGGEVKIGNNSMFGLNCTIKHGVSIADYTLVGAGAYISKDTEKGSVYVPEKSIKLCKDSREMVI